jgi:tight adherence protein C
MDSTTLIPLITVFLSVAVAAGVAASYLLRVTSPVDRRLRGIGPGAQTGRPGLSELDLTRPSYGSLESVAGLMPKAHKDLSKLRRRMAMAGFERPEAAVLYALAELVLPIVFGGTVYLYFHSTRGLLFAVIAGFIGYMLPGLWLGKRISERRRQIQNGLPDALDLLLVTMEAGSGLDQAIVKVANELVIACPPLAAEFRNMVTEMRAGRPRSEALRQFADRTKVEDVRTLVATMIQTDKFGTSIGQALRTHADTARTRRRQRAEERAQKLGVKLVFPLVFCLFPAMFVVVLGPAILKIIRFFLAQG